MSGRTKIIVAAAAFWAERGLAESRGVEQLRDSELNFGAVDRAEMIRVDRIVRGVPKQKNRAKKRGVDDGGIGLSRAATSGEIDIGEMEWRAVGGRAHIFGEEKCGAEIVGDAMNPVRVGRIVGGETGKKPGHG
jgi:hypothetical protein